jgi:hypothetical protein
MCASGCAIGRVPQAASARANANHGAAAGKRMQECSVSVCFLKRTLSAFFISFSRLKRNEKSSAERGVFPARESM